jgi:SAM-dependent methyltransferase
MRKLFAVLCCLTSFGLQASTALTTLINFDKTSCLEQLQQATDVELWDAFLEGQANLFFDSEFDWIAKNSWWRDSLNVLEIGSGNGAYLHRLFCQSRDKRFRGIERVSYCVEQANQRYVEDNLAFQVGDAEIFDLQLIRSADIVLFRMVLQHLMDPAKALEHVADYLLPNGHVLIIESYDGVRRSSRSISTIDEALRRVAEIQGKQGTKKGNRRVTLELLQRLERGSSPLCDLYEIAFSNIDSEGNLVVETIRLEGARSRALYFNHGLLFLTLMHRTFAIPVPFSIAYDELMSYYEDEGAWASPGVHFLVLKRKGC